MAVARSVNVSVGSESSLSQPCPRVDVDDVLPGGNANLRTPTAFSVLAWGSSIWAEGSTRRQDPGTDHCKSEFVGFWVYPKS